MTKGSLDERTIRRKSLPTVETRTLSLSSHHHSFPCPKRRWWKKRKEERERYVQRQHAISGSLLIFWNRMPIFLSSLDSPGIYLFNEVNQGRERDGITKRNEHRKKPGDRSIRNWWNVMPNPNAFLVKLLFLHLISLLPDSPTLVYFISLDELERKREKDTSKD